MNDEEFTIVIPSNRMQLAKECQENLLPLNSIIFDGTGYSSYSKIMNDVIVFCPTELLIICNDKGRPEAKHVNKVIDLIKEGYGMAWLHPFGFGGFYKDLIRQIGFYDERFIDGNYEDCDMFRRLKENNIALYEQFEIEWIKMKSSWNGKQSKKHLETKWKETNATLKRSMAEQEYVYDIGEHKNIKFLPWDRSIVAEPSKSFKDAKII